MKTMWWILGISLIVAIPLVRFLLLRLREKRAQRDGVAVYATVVSMDIATFLGKPSSAVKIRMWIQEPGEDRREITLTSRIAPGQNVVPGVMLPVVVDPADKKRVYPAGPEAAKRVQLTGSRQQRRQMRAQGL
jgi:hypothetical protein